MRSSDKTIVAACQTTKEVSKEGVRECVAGNVSMQTNKKYASNGETHSIYYTLDAQGRVYAFVTRPGYPPRVAFAAIEELRKSFSEELGPRVASATNESLNKASLQIFKDIYYQFGDPSSTDALTSVQGKLDVVTTQMKENITQILSNTEKLEHIEDLSVNIKDQAILFERNAEQLRDKMFWKKVKMVSKRVCCYCCYYCCYLLLINIITTTLYDTPSNHISPAPPTPSTPPLSPPLSSSFYLLHIVASHWWTYRISVDHYYRTTCSNS